MFETKVGLLDGITLPDLIHQAAEEHMDIDIRIDEDGITIDISPAEIQKEYISYPSVTPYYPTTTPYWWNDTTGTPSSITASATGTITGTMPSSMHVDAASCTAKPNPLATPTGNYTDDLK